MEELEFRRTCLQHESSAAGLAASLCRLAEFSFATGRSDLAGEVLAGAVDTLWTAPDKQVVPTQLAILGAALGAFEVSVDPKGFRIRHIWNGEVREFAWSGTQRSLTTGTGLLVAAALAGKSSLDSILDLVGEAAVSSTIGRLACNSDVADILPAFGFVRVMQGAFRLEADYAGWKGEAAISRMEDRYEAAIRLAIERPDWSPTRSRVPLVDWRLVCIQKGAFTPSS